jgi:hypothetical protein
MLPAGRHDGQQPLHEPTAGRAVRPEAPLAPQHRRAQGTLRDIVGRLHPFHPCEGPQSVPLPVERTAQRRCLAIRALLAAPQQPSHPGLDRYDLPAQFLPVELAISAAVPQRKQPLNFRQPPAPDRLRFTAPVHQRLRVPFEVSVAQRPPLSCQPTLGRPAI